MSRASGTAQPASGSFLIWEDVDADGRASAHAPWWLARAHEQSPEGSRDFFVAEDDVSGYVVGVVLPRTPDPHGGQYRVISATPAGDAVDLGDAVATVKEQVATWLVGPEDPGVNAWVGRWRRRRSWVIARANTPLALGAFVIGGLLGFAVAMFAVSSGLIGWPMVLAGVFIGASAGSFLKLIADKKPTSASPALAGSWGRFAVVTVSAMIGAGIVSGTVLTLFPN